MLGFTYTVPLDLPVILHSMWNQSPKYLNEIYCVSWFQVNFWELFANSAIPMLMKMLLYNMYQWYITHAKILELVFLHFTVFP